MYVIFVAIAGTVIQCGAIIARSIFTQILTKNTQ